MTRARQERPAVRSGPGFALVAYAFAVTMLGTTLPTPLYPIYQAEYGFSALTITVIFAVYAAGVIAGLVLVGPLSDQIGRRRVLLPGLLIAALAAVVFLLPGGLPALLAARILSGISAGVFTGTATATLLDLAPRDKRNRAGLVAAAVNMGGLGLGPPVAGLLSQYAPHPLALCYVLDLVLVLLAMLGLRLVPETVELPERPRLRPQKLGVPPETRPTFVRAVTAGFAGFAVLGLFTAISPSFLGQVLGVHNHAAVGFVVFSLFVGSTAGQVLASLGQRRQALLAGCLVLAVGAGCIAASLVAVSLPLLVLGAVVSGLGQGASFRSALTEVGNAAPAAQRAEVSSSFFVAIYVAISLPVVGVGALEQAVGLVTAGVGFAVLIGLLALVAFAALVRHAKPA